MLTTKTPLELLKEELCSQYDLQPEQISFEITVKDLEKEKALSIARDFCKSDYGLIKGKEIAMGSGRVPGLWVNAYYKEGEENDQ